jgi:hypothetical protein
MSIRILIPSGECHAVWILASRDDEQPMTTTLIATNVTATTSFVTNLNLARGER